MTQVQQATQALRRGRDSLRRRKTLRVEDTRRFVRALFGLDMHAARLESLANAVAGVLSAAVLSIHAIGHAYAVLEGIKGKSGVKQIDRLLSNPGIDVLVLQNVDPAPDRHTQGIQIGRAHV